MSTLQIDLNDNPSVLRAGRDMLNTLLGEGAGRAVVEVDGEGISIESNAAVRVDGQGTEGTQKEVTTVVEGALPASDQVDPHGVTFDPEYCGVSETPFYTSGKRKDQWKKKRNVPDATYDAWYLTQLPTKEGTQNTGTGDDEPVNTAGAFSGQQQQADGASDATPAPQSCGEFMGWVSAKQAAELLTQEDIGNAYATADIEVSDLFSPDDALVKQRVTALYQILAAKAGA